MRLLKMLAEGHTEVKQPNGEPSKITPHDKGDVLEFPPDRYVDADRLVQLGLAEDVTPRPAPIAPEHA